MSGRAIRRCVLPSRTETQDYGDTAPLTNPNDRTVRRDPFQYATSLADDSDITSSGCELLDEEASAVPLAELERNNYFPLLPPTQHLSTAVDYLWMTEIGASVTHELRTK